MCEGEKKMKNTSKVLWGLLLICLGIIIGINSLGLANIDIFFEGWWTLFIIIPCFIGLFNSSESKVGNIIGLCIGVALLLAARNIISFEIIAKLFFPFILIAIGLSLIFRNCWKKVITEKVNTSKKNGLETIVATFSEQKLEKDGEVFEGLNLDVVFGSIVLDLTNAKLKEENVITASAIFGGITILVPKDVAVKVKPTSIFGGVSNNVPKAKDEKKVIYIESFALFGGIDIK